MKIRGFGKFGNTLWFPVATLLLLLGLASPVYFTSISQDTLEMVGEGTSSLSTQAEQQLRENNLGPVEMILPLLSPAESAKFKTEIDERKNKNRDLEVSGGGSIFDLLTFREYFGGLDEYSREQKRFSAYFVYNRAATRGDLWKRLEESSSNKNVQAILASIPKEGRPGAFWAKVINEPNLSSFPGTKLIRLENFRFFPQRRLLVSVALRSKTEIDANASEAEIRDDCLAEARQTFASEDSLPRGFSLSRDGREMAMEANASVLDAADLASLDYPSTLSRLGIIKSGPTPDGGYEVMLGGVVGPDGKLEEHGRWLPYPMLVPMMVGTAMAIEKDYFSSTVGYELGKLSQGLLAGNLEAKEKLRAFYWAAHQLARKLNLIQMAEVTKRCPDLKGVFDLATLIRMRNRPLSEVAGKIKAARREISSLAPEETEEKKVELKKLYSEREETEKRFQRELSVVYAATLLSGEPSGVLSYVKGFPVYDANGDEVATVEALDDLEFAMGHGAEALKYLLQMRKPVHNPGPVLSSIQPVFPVVGGGLLTWFSHAYQKSAMFLKLSFFLIAGALFSTAIANLLPKPDYSRSVASPILRFLRNFTVGSMACVLILFLLEPTLLQTPRGQVSVAGFDFALANLLMSADDDSMLLKDENSLTIVTGAVAGTFLLLQLVIFVFCLLRISQVKREEADARLKVKLLDNEDTLFDLGLYVGLGGTVLSLILLLVLDVKQDALIGAYTSTLFGILFVAALKIFFVRPYRNHLLVMQAEQKRYEP